MKLYKKIFLVLALISIQTPQLSFCMEQESNLQYQTYSLLFYNTLTSKYFMAAVFLYGISPFSPFLFIRNSWNYTWNKLFRSLPPKNNDKKGFHPAKRAYNNNNFPQTNPLFNDPEKTIMGCGQLITQTRAINPFDKVYCCMGHVTFDNDATQNNLIIRGEETILNALDIQVINSRLTISSKAGFNLKPTIKRQLDITLGISNINKLTVAGPSIFIFNNLSRLNFELNAQQGATIQSNSLNSFRLINGTFNSEDHAIAVINGNMQNLTITAKEHSNFKFTGNVSTNIFTTLSKNSTGTIQNDQNFESFFIEMVASCSLEAQGNTDTQTINLKNGSVYDGTKMQSSWTTIKSMDNSEAIVREKDIITGTINEKSKLTLYGNPIKNNLNYYNSKFSETEIHQDNKVIGCTITTT